MDFLIKNGSFFNPNCWDNVLIIKLIFIISC